MSAFLNIDLEGKIPVKYIVKHILFSLLWILIFTILFFRVDVLLISKYESFQWLIGILPLIYIIFLLIFTVSQKWYGLAFVFYPILAFFWFIPKTILTKGKIYLFGHYVNGLFSKLQKPKLALFHLGLFLIPLILVLITNNILVRWISILSFSYFYIRYILKYLFRSFKPAQLFGTNLETTLGNFIIRGKNNESQIINSYIIQKADEKLPAADRSKNQITRLVLANHALIFVSSSINSYKGKRAYLIALIYELFIFLIISVLFFWFLNYQVFHIDSNNFIINGIPSKFEFLYYTLKTITFDNVPSVLPNSVISKTIEIASFFVVGVFLLIIVASIFFSFRQDKMKEDIKLAIKICKDQNRIIEEYMKTEFNTDINSAIKEISSIRESIEKLQKLLKNIF